MASTGWSEPAPGRELHPLKSSAFHGALLRHQSTVLKMPLVSFGRVFCGGQAVDKMISQSLTMTSTTPRTARCTGFQLAYGKGSLSPANRLAHCAVGTPAMFAPPVMIDFESQNRSTLLPPMRVGTVLALTSRLERLATTSPP